MNTEQPKRHWLNALKDGLDALKVAKDGADAAGEELSRDEIHICLVTLEQLHRRKQ